VIARREHLGPLVVQRALYPEPSGACHIYLVHPPGGIVGGDRLELDVEVAEKARAVMTTPAATKFYRSAGERSEVLSVLRVRPGGCFEWLPQETIVFSGARARATTRIELCGDASFIGWEISCLGRRASGETFSEGHFEQRLRLERDGEPLFRERSSLSGGGVELGAPWGMAGRSCQGTLVAVGPRARAGALLEKARASVSARTGLFAATTLGDLLVCRFLGDQASEARRVFERVWEVVRSDLLGWRAVAPRIWAT
jgi:urease accessory protein